MEKYIENKLDTALATLKDLNQNSIKVFFENFDFEGDLFIVAKDIRGEWRIIMGEEFHSIWETFNKSNIVSLDESIKAIEAFRATLGVAKEFTFKKRKLGYMTENAHKILRNEGLEDSIVAVDFNGIEVICTEDEMIVFNLVQTKESIKMQIRRGGRGVVI